MKIRTFIVDAFTDQPFKGNPAGVCLLEQPLDVPSMQKIANELKHSETAFVTLTPNSNGQLPIRYFTPATEIDFCGHATLGSSKVILEKLGKSTVELRTFAGLDLSANKGASGVTMKFPLYDSVAYTPKKEMLDVLGLQESEIKAARYSKDVAVVILEVGDKETVLRIQPDFKLLTKSETGIEKLVITTKSNDAQYDFYSRCFCPWLGIDEDPVTGAVHTVLAKYWGDKLNKKVMKAFQCSERGGYLDLVIKGEKELEVSGHAHIILEGELSL